MVNALYAQNSCIAWRETTDGGLVLLRIRQTQSRHRNVSVLVSDTLSSGSIINTTSIAHTRFLRQPNPNFLPKLHVLLTLSFRFFIEL